MEILRKHYEKIILSVVLLGLAAAAAFLPLKVANVRRDLETVTQDVMRKPVKPLPPLDLSTNRAALERLLKPPKATFANPGHNVFNPIQWKRNPSGTLVPQEQFGLSSLVVTKIVPLHLKIEFRGARERLRESDEIRYDFIITREYATNAPAQRPALRFVTLGGKTEVFILKDVVGPPENPEAVVVELIDSKKSVTIPKDGAFTEVVSYAADLRYDAENKVFPKQRTGSKLNLSGSSYNIVAIGADTVTLEDALTKKRTTIPLKATS
ncbi:MAG: hypothetical protein N3G20_10050 [Verrucomicrobiae bacterium]|nr:hypothetical protein [Verrucomicrobiae bacterium]